MRYKSNGCLTGRGVAHLLLQLQDKTESNALQIFLASALMSHSLFTNIILQALPYLKSNRPEF